MQPSRAKNVFVLVVITMIASITAAQAASNPPVDKYGYPYQTLDGLLKDRKETQAWAIVQKVPRRPGDEDDRTLWKFACVANTQDFERAKEIVSTVKNFECATGHTLLLAGSTYLQLQEYERAIFFLNLAVKRDPGYEDCYSTRADAHNALKRYEEAIKDLETASKVCPRRKKEFYAKAAILLISLGQSQRALTMMEKVQINSKNLSDASFFLAKASCYSKLKRDADSIAALSQGIDICKSIKGTQKENSEYLLIRLLQEREKAYKLLNRLEAAKADHAATEKISKRFENDILGEH